MTKVKWLDYLFLLEKDGFDDPIWNAYRMDGPADQWENPTKRYVCCADSPEDLRLKLISQQETAALQAEERLKELRGEPFAVVGTNRAASTVLSEIRSAASEVVAEWDATGELSDATLTRLRKCL